MKILFCNKYNYPFSGTEVYLFEVMELLRSHGHDAELFSMADPRAEPTNYDRYFVSHIDFKAPSGWPQQAAKAAHAIYSTEARRKLRNMIRDFRPDVAHVRSIYHHLSPSILWELKAQGIPVLLHINDFKLLCPAYNLLSKGKVCERCRGGTYWHMHTSRCYPGLAARSTLMTEAYLHRYLGTYRKCVDLFLAPSQFVRDKFVEHGWDPEQFRVLPHFQAVHPLPSSSPVGNGSLLYVGRLSGEKGVADLLYAMQRIPQQRLILAGEGPEKPALQQLATELRLSNVEFVGQVGAAERDALIAQSLFTIFPTHAYETLGKTILESYAGGRPVIATDLGSRRELVQHDETGLLYRCGDVNDLTLAIRKLASDPALAQKMGRAGWNLVRQNHTPESHYAKLAGLYEELVSTKSRRRGWGSIQGKLKSNLQFPAPTAAASLRQTTPKLRIAFIGGRGVISKYSGIETYYEEVGKELVKLGHEVTVYCRTHFTPKLREHNGMKLVRLPTFRSKHFETLIHTTLSTMHALTRSYDVVHYHALGPALFSLLPRVRGIKTAVTVQGLDWQRKKWARFAAAVLKIGEHASAHFPHQTMVVSQVLRDHYCSVHRKQTLYIPNGGILRDRSEPRKILEWGLEPGRYVLFLGRFSPEKGCHLLVQAFEQIETDVKLIMAGGASYCDDYSRELHTHASDRIRMLDWVSGEALDELLTNAMVFVLPSEMEGLSLALLDAMGAGLCVLASDVPENREAVDGAGFTFRSGSMADLADRLRFLIANPAVREAAGKAARRQVEERYQWRTIAAQIESAYFELLGAQAPPRPKRSMALHQETDGSGVQLQAG